MNYLAIDTSTQSLTVALQAGDQLLVRHEHAPKRHGELLLPWVDELMQQAQLETSALDALFCGIGPGGFTGIRLGVGVMQALAAVHALPIVALSSLQVLAQTAADQFGCRHVLTAQDARMGEVYWAGYVQDDQGLMQHQLPDQLCAPNQVDVPKAGKWQIVGDAWPVYAESLAERLQPIEYEIITDLQPHAQSMLKLGVQGLNQDTAISADQLLPVYLRGESAWKKHEAK